MLKAIEKAKALKEFKELRLKLGSELSALEKAKSLKRFRELRVLLGGQNQSETEPANNPLYQSVIDGAEITVDLIEQLKAEAEKDLTHPQLRPAVKIVVEKAKALATIQEAA